MPPVPPSNDASGHIMPLTVPYRVKYMYRSIIKFELKSHLKVSAAKQVANNSIKHSTAYIVSCWPTTLDIVLAEEYEILVYNRECKIIYWHCQKNDMLVMVHYGSDCLILVTTVFDPL